jgi:hypothetical protein
VRQTLHLLLSAVMAFAPAAAGAAPYFRVTKPIGDPRSSGDPLLPPGIDKDSVFGTGAIALYAPVSVRGRPGVAFRLRIGARQSEGPLNWASVGAPLPEGLTLRTDGLVTGSPKSVGDTAGIVVEARDGTGRSGRTQPFTVTVAPLPTVTLATSTVLQAGTFARIVPVAENLFGSKVWTLAGTLPAGMALDASTGAIQGTPVQKGGFGGLSLQVTDADGARGEAPVASISVEAKLDISGLSRAYVARLGRAMAPIRPQVSGNGGDVTWDVDPAGTDLPAGLSLDGTTGTVAGTPGKEGMSGGLALRARDSSDGSTLASAFFSLRVAGAPAVTAGEAYQGRIGRPFTFTPTVRNMLGSTEWTASAGLPAGLYLDRASGTVSGSIASRGTAVGIVLSATDLFDGERASTAALSITGWPDLAIVSPAAPQAIAGTPFAMPAPAVHGLRGTPVHSLGGTVPPGLSVDPDTGAIAGTPALAGSYDLVRTVLDGADGVHASSAPVRVEVAGPGAAAAFAVAPMPDRYPGTVGKPFALTPSVSGAQGSVSWSLVGQLPGWATFSAEDGTISGIPAEAVSSDPLVLVAHDGPNGPTASSTAFHVAVAPAAPLALSLPALVSGAVSTPLSGPVPSVVNGIGGSVFEVAAGPIPDGLALDPQTGVLSGTPTVSGDFAGLVLKVRDGSGAEASSDPFTVRIDPAVPGIGTNSPPWASISSAMGELNRPMAVTAEAKGLSPVRTWSLAQGTLPGWASLDTVSGTISGTPTSVGSTDGLVLSVRDDRNVATRTNPFRLSAVSSPSASLTASMGDVSAALGRRIVGRPSVSGANGATDWTLAEGTLPKGLEVDPGTGTISGTPTETGAWTGVSLAVRDETNAKARTNPFRVDVLRTPLAVSGPGRLRVHAGYPLTSGLPSVTGNLGPVAWTLSGPVPPGISLGPEGTLRGSTAAVGSHGGLALVARDTDGATAASQPFAIDVTDLPTARMDGQRARAGMPFSATPRIDGAIGSVSWSKGSAGFPDWLALDPSTGTLSGTPPAPGTVPALVLTATDASGVTVSTLPFGISIDRTLAAGMSPNAFTARVGVPFRAPLPTADADGDSHSWSAADGAIPTWAKLDARTGELSGTPDSVGNATFALSVSDADGYAAKTAPITVAVTAAPSVSVGPDQGGRVGAPLTVSPGVSGAVGLQAWSLSGGLPDWVRLDGSSGALTGIPTAPYVAEGLRFTVVDSEGARGTSDPFSIRVRNGIAVAGLSTPRTLRVGTPSAPEQARVVGAAGAVSWSAAGLPGGLSISDGGLLYGTPSQSGTFPATVTARDASDGAADAKALAFTVIPAMQAMGPESALSTHPGPFTAPAPSIVGQKGTVSWRASAGAVPTWATVAPGTGILSGTATTVGIHPGIVLEGRDDFDGATAPTKPFDIRVVADPHVVDMATNYTGRIGFAFASKPPRLVDAIGAVRWTWGDGAAPPGWSRLDPETGVISGTPDAGGTSGDLTLVGTDSRSGSAPSVPFRLNVHAMPSIALDETAIKVRVGKPVSVAPRLTGLAGTPTWSLVTESGGIAPGLAFDASDGSFGGTPTGPGTGRFRIHVADAADGGEGDSPAFAVSVLPSFTLAAAKDAVRGHAGTFLTSGTARLAGNVGTIRFRSSPLPAGLLLDDAGAVSGTPSDPDGFSGTVTLTATDEADGTEAATSFGLTILPPFQAFHGQASIKGRVGADMASIAPPTASNAYSAADVRWTLASGTLPGNVSLNELTGALSGKPIEPVSLPGFQLQARDADGAVALTPPVVIVVAPALALDLSGAPASASELASFAYQPGASGLTGTATWTVSGLPEGVSASPSGRIAGTPALGASSRSPYAVAVTLADAWDGTSVIGNLPMAILGVPSLRIASPIRLPDQALPDPGRCLDVPVTNAGTAPAAGLSVSVLTGGPAIAACPASSDACGPTLAVGATCAFGARLAATSAGEKSGLVMASASTGPSLQAEVGGMVLDDVTADPFVIPSLVDQVPGARVASPPIRIGGLTAAVPVSVLGPGAPQVRIEGGPWTSAGTIRADQSIEVQVTAPATAVTTQASTVTVGGVSSDFVVRTGDPVPDAFAIAPVAGATGGAAVASEPVALAGMTVEATFSLVPGGSYAVRLGVNGAPPSATLPASIPANARLVLSLDAASGTDGGTRGATLTVGGVTAQWTVTTIDTTPANFAFQDVGDVPAGSLAASTPVTVSGITAPAPASVSGEGNPEISVSGGPWGTSGTVSPGQSIRVRLTAAASENGTPRSATVLLGGKVAGWTVTTRDTIPDAFAFPDSTNQPQGTTVVSAPVVVGGISTQAAVSVSGTADPQVRVAGGAWSATAFAVAGQSVEVRQTTGSGDGDARTATVSIGGVISTWTAVTGVATPGPFSFPATANAPVNAAVASQPATLERSTIEAPLTLSAGGAYPVRIGIDGAAPTISVPARIRPNARIVLSLDTPGTPDGTARSATLTINGVAATWSVTTVDTVPNAFAFANQAGQNPNTPVASPAVAILGIGAATPVSVSGQGSPQVSVAGGAWTAGPTSILPGQTLSVRLTSAATALSTQSASVTVGGVSAGYSVTTRGTDASPDAFAIAPQAGLNPGGLALSQVQTPTGYDAPFTVSVSAPAGAPMLSIDRGPLVASGTIYPGQGFQVQATAGAFLERRDIQVTAGDKAATWSLTSRAQDTTPDAFAFASLSGRAGSSLAESESYLPVGYADPAPVTVSGPGSPQVSIADGPYAATGTLTPGQRIRVRLTTDIPDARTRTASVSIGGMSAPFSVTTVDTMPDVPWTQAELDGHFTKIGIGCCQCLPYKSLTGYTSPPVMGSAACTVTPAGNPPPAVGYLDNGAYRNPGYVHATNTGDFSLCIHTDNSQPGDAGTCTLDVGGKSIAFKYSLVDRAPDPSGFPQLPFFAGKAPGSEVVTPPASVSGNRSPSLISIGGPGQLEVGGAWYGPGVQVRLGVNQTFRVKATVPASGTSRIYVYHGESGQANSYFEVTPNPVKSNLSVSYADGAFLPYGGTTIGGEFVRYDVPISIGTDGNVCVPFATSTDRWRAANLNNVTRHWFYSFLTGRETGSEAAWSWRPSGFVCPGETMYVYVTPPSTAAGRLDATLTIADKAIPLSYVLAGPNIDGVPDAFSFPNLTGQSGNALITSQPTAPLSGFSTQTSASVSGQGSPQISLDGGATWATSGTASPGNTVMARLTTGAADGTGRAATVNVGGTAATFTVSTADQTPDAFALPPRTSVDPGTRIQSSPITVSGLAGPAVVAVSGPGSPSVLIGSGGYAQSGTVVNGQTVTVAAYAPSGHNASHNVVLGIGTGQATWTLSTRPEDTAPAAFSIRLPADAPATQPVGSLVQSDDVTLAAFLDPAPISVSGDGNPTLSVDDGATWSPSAAIRPGGRFRVRLTTSPSPGTSSRATVVVGGVAGTFDVSTTP